MLREVALALPATSPLERVKLPYLDPAEPELEARIAKRFGGRP